MRTVYTTIKISQPQYDVELFRFYRTGVGRQLYLKQSSITQNDSTATVRYHYDGACRIDSLRLGKDVVKAMSYNANGWLTRSSVSGPMLIKFPPADPDLPILPRPGQAKAVAHKGNIFNETLHYADAAAAGAPRYDGKISVRNCDNALTAYAYDCHGRLITSTSYSYRGGAASADFSTEYAYDRNANLLNVTRNGIIDNVRGIRTYGINNDISMHYSANRLKSITVTAEGADYEGRTGLPQYQSSGVDFTYDPNGNMISDAVRGITDIRYNRLNLPVRLTFADGHRQIIAYDGFGRKTKIDYAQGPETIFGGDLPAEQDYVITSSRIYSGPHIFADGQLEYSAFDGGYFNADGSPCYYITDWQGNNAAVVNSAGSVIQSVAYYPYGEPTVEPKGQRFLFGGKEREHAGGRNAYDFGARSLTPFGSWPSPDPKAEDFYQISTFSYCAGDPINFIDPTGNRRWPVSDGPSIQNLQHSNDFGKVRTGSNHPHGGVDINYEGDDGGPVYATHDGIVSRIVDKADGNGGGIRLKITSYDEHVSTFYMHMEKITEGINLGDAIVEGQEIGKIGSTGRSKGAHVHYEISIDGKRVNPAIDSKTLIDAQLLNKNHLNEIMVRGIHIVRLENLIDLTEYLNKEIDKYIESIKPKMILEVLHY